MADESDRGGTAWFEDADGGARETVVVGGSAQVSDVLLGDDEGEMWEVHLWTSRWSVVARTVVCLGCGALTAR